MERALDARERSVLGALPALLEAHFKRLRDAARAEAETEATTPAEVTAPAPTDAQTRPEAAQAVAAPRANAWLDLFREDMRAVLLAELDVRFQPVEGLLAALRAS
jgi:hypothetical protein